MRTIIILQVGLSTNIR